MASEVEETLKRIGSHRGVLGVIIATLEGVPIRSTFDKAETTQLYSTVLTQLATKTKSVCREMEPQNDVTFIRIRTKRYEIMLAPDKEFLLIVLQDPSSVRS